jgi:hypothetical protein
LTFLNGFFDALLCLFWADAGLGMRLGDAISSSSSRSVSWLRCVELVRPSGDLPGPDKDLLATQYARVQRSHYYEAYGVVSRTADVGMVSIMARSRLRRRWAIPCGGQ